MKGDSWPMKLWLGFALLMVLYMATALGGWMLWGFFALQGIVWLIALPFQMWRSRVWDRRYRETMRRAGVSTD